MIGECAWVSSQNLRKPKNSLSLRRGRRKKAELEWPHRSREKKLGWEIFFCCLCFIEKKLLALICFARYPPTPTAECNAVIKQWSRNLEISMMMLMIIIIESSSYDHIMIIDCSALPCIRAWRILGPICKSLCRFRKHKYLYSSIRGNIFEVMVVVQIEGINIFRSARTSWRKKKNIRFD